MRHSPKHFDERTSLFSASCPFGKLSVWQNVRSAKRPFGKTSVGKMSVRQMSFGKVSFGKMSGYLKFYISPFFIHEPGEDIRPIEKLESFTAIFGKFSLSYYRNLCARWMGNGKMKNIIEFSINDQISS
jgi:hypothetical protein